MALNGLWQLKKLVVRYCDWGGSSRGMREFIESQLPTFKQQNPQLEVVPLLKRGKHPHLRGYYRDKTVRIDCVKNMDPEDILLRAMRFRNALGAEVRKLKNRHMTKNRSVQGTWTTATKI
ncbi:large ribosomal subunit protein mL43 [Cryptomeria japonica]|uniref:large ribosomal subunit protein mL43 n=1 Tax=Cryptomeria japonica TaxID=3369 RepID=UPI0025AB7C83|nr:large ribosomal subunit protein mL43 [Cryptomeria japonica]